MGRRGRKRDRPSHLPPLKFAKHGERPYSAGLAATPIKDNARAFHASWLAGIGIARCRAGIVHNR
jgi:hypothetical protein